MATHVQVVLKEDVHNLGKTGELVRVRPGYARNFLLPRGLAVAPTEGNLARIEHERQAALARAAKLRETAEGEARALSSVSVQITKQIGEEGKLFGSVTAKDVAEALHKAGHKVDRKTISIVKPIREAGEHEATVKLAPQVSATIKVVVVKAEV